MRSMGRYEPSARHEAARANSCSRSANREKAPGGNVAPVVPSFRCKSLRITSMPTIPGEGHGLLFLV